MGRKRRYRKRLHANRSITEIANTISEGNVFQPPAKRPTITRPNFSMYSLNRIPPPIQVSPFRSRFSGNSYPYRWLSTNPYWHASPPVHTPVAVVTPLRVVQVAASLGPPTLSAPGSVKSSSSSLHGVRVAASAANACPVPPTSSAPGSVKSSRTLNKETSLSNTFSLQDHHSIQDQIASSRAQALAVYVAAFEARKIACKNTAVNVSSDTDPVMAPSATHQITELSVNASVCDATINVKTPNEEEEDVIYLYSVQPEKGKLIEVVDLAEDSNAISSERNLFLSSQNPNPQDEAEMMQALNKNSPDSQEVLKTPPLISILENNGSVLPLPAGRKRKREENVDTHCSACHRHYVDVRKDDNQLFISKCGHIFCMSCLRNLVPYKCTECNAGISNLCKVIF